MHGANIHNILYIYYTYIIHTLYSGVVNVRCHHDHAKHEWCICGLSASEQEHFVTSKGSRSFVWLSTTCMTILNGSGNHRDHPSSSPTDNLGAWHWCHCQGKHACLYLLCRSSQLLLNTCPNKDKCVQMGWCLLHPCTALKVVQAHLCCSCACKQHCLCTCSLQSDWWSAPYAPL